MKTMVGCVMYKGINLGYVESIHKNTKENENCSKNEIEFGHLESKKIKENKSIKSVPKRNEKN